MSCSLLSSSVFRVTRWVLRFPIAGVLLMVCEEFHGEAVFNSDIFL
jgi:hypothetical protein